MRRGLEPILVGNAFARVEQRRPDLRFPLPNRFGERLSGRRVEALDRRAKYLLARLDDGEVLVMHLGMPKSGASRTNQAYRTGACGTRPIVPFAGYSGETVIVPKLDQRGPRVYSPIIRTGLSPPSQSSPLNLVVTGKGFLCLRCKEGGNLVDRLCVTCGYSWWNSERSHHILWSAPDLYLRRTVVLKGGGLL